MNEYYPQEFVDMIVPGKSVKLDFGERNINTKRIHILEIYEDYYVACKSWLKHSQQWDYRFENMYYLYLVWKDGNLKK